jgi:hypothetical protein
MMKEINIIDNFKEFDLLKSKKTGYYTDTSENRKKGRVGQKYKKDKKEKGPDKNILSGLSAGDKIMIDLDGEGEKEIVTIGSGFKTGVGKDVDFVQLDRVIGAPYTITRKRFADSVQGGAVKLTSDNIEGAINDLEDEYSGVEEKMEALRARKRGGGTSHPEDIREFSELKERKKDIERQINVHEYHLGDFEKSFKDLQDLHSGFLSERLEVQAKIKELKKSASKDGFLYGDDALEYSELVLVREAVDESLNKVEKEINIEKGVKTGIYTDTHMNRKLGRVGQKYKKEDVNDAEAKKIITRVSKKINSSNPGNNERLLEIKTINALKTERNRKVGDASKQLYQRAIDILEVPYLKKYENDLSSATVKR